MASNKEQPIAFFTFGMFILDEIHFKPPTQSVFNIVGGAGSFAAVGARLVSPPPLAKSVGWIVDAGRDFPPELRSLISSWGTGCDLRETPNRLTTRGWNGYGENEKRAFQFTTPKARIGPESLDQRLLTSTCFHVICSPTRCMEIISGTMQRRMALTDQRPLFIWEPIPDLCTLDELANCYDTLGRVDVVSPNHLELCAFFGEHAHDEDMKIKRDLIQYLSGLWLEKVTRVNPGLSVVVRAGKHGCYLATQSHNCWLPAYHRKDSAKVVDPTGGGNAFLGGFGARLARLDMNEKWNALVSSVIYGSVAASFAIEQVGTPELLRDEPANEEKWNGVKVEDRLEDFIRACHL